MGIHEVIKGINNGRVKLVVIAPNIEKVSTKDGLDSKIEEILLLSKQRNIDVIYALNRKKIALILNSKSKTCSVVGIFNPDGTNFKECINLANKCKILYQIQKKSYPLPEGIY